MKNKPLIITGLIVLIVLLAVSIFTVNKPQQAGTKAQALDAVQQCQSDGGFVTDQTSCSGPGKQLLNVIGDGSGGDATTIQVCCKNITVVTSVPGPSCPDGTVEKPEAECPSGQIVTPINASLADGVESKYVSPGIVCCKPANPTPSTAVPTTTPTPSSCPLPDAPAISVSNVKVTCPGDCTDVPQ